MQSIPQLVEIFEKPRCTQCTAMRKVFDKWHEENPEVKVEVKSAKENRDYLLESGALGAPVYRIVGASGEEQFVSGLNPDLLMDLLNGDDSLWDF